MSTRVRVPATLSLINQAKQRGRTAAAATSPPPVPPQPALFSATDSKMTPGEVAQDVQVLKSSTDWFIQQFDLIAGLKGRWTQASVEILEQACARYRAQGEPARVRLARMDPADLLAGLRLLYEQQHNLESSPQPPKLSVFEGGRQ